MPQLSLYIDQELYMEIKTIAEKKNTSISRVVNGMIKENLDNSWPEGFLDFYYGAMKDDPIEEPEEIPWSLDSPRETL